MENKTWIPSSLEQTTGIEPVFNPSYKREYSYKGQKIHLLDTPGSGKTGSMDMLAKILEDEILLDNTKDEDLPLLVGRNWMAEKTRERYAKKLKEYADSQA